MATYLSGSNIQSDAMQTLYLMNPGYAGYTDASNPNNMVLISPLVGVEQYSPLTNSSQHQHHQFLSFPLPPTLAHNSLVQHSALTDTPTSSIGQQNPISALFPNQVTNHIYNWTGGNELSFIPSNDVAHVSHHSSVNSGQQSGACDISLYGVRHQSVSALHEQQEPLLQREVALGLNVDNTQASSGAGHGLSLSLSPQQPSAIQVPIFHMQHAEPAMSNGAALSHVAEDNINRGDRFHNKWTRSLSSFRASSRDRFLGSSYYQNTTNDAGSIKQPLLEIGASMKAGPDGLFTRSKYLKVAQLLLDEVVSVVGRGFKSNSTKQTKLQSWIEPTSTFNFSFPRERTQSENRVKEGISTVPAIVPSIPEHINVTGITQAEKQELQMKKAKLKSMLAEVDQRYTQYYNQMQVVVTSFESAAGLGAAKTYTALALKTISRHFHSLRDAIGRQMRIAAEALGEEDALPQMTGETSQLQFVDQQLRQHRALQQLGMMQQQQHTWRPQRGLPERSVSILRAWLFEHFLHPYPKDADKLVLARQTGLTRSQVSNWFINARVRLWKPMVEEMYLEETMEAGAMAEKKMLDETQNLSKSASAPGSVNHEGEEKQTKTEAEGSQEKPSVPDHTSELLRGRSPSMNMTSYISDGEQFSRENSTRQEGVKKSRYAIQDSATLVSPNTSTDVDIKPEETRSGDVCENGNKPSKEDSHSRDDYSFFHSGLEGLAAFGSCQEASGGTNTRYCQEIPATTAPRYSGSSGVSLTLGLQRCDGLSLSSTQQRYVYGHGHGLQQSGRGGQNVGIGGETEESSYHWNSTGQSNGGFETISFPSRKQVLQQQQQHDFVWAAEPVLLPPA